MNKNVFLGVLLSMLVLPMMTGCNNQNQPKTKNNSTALNKTTLGEASINNISKYTAIGVGKLDKKSPNKKYRLITDKNNDEVEEEDNSVDLSNTLVGLTTEGVLEELSLTIQSGQQLNSSAFNVTYYEEIGDFVLISVLPMDVQEYVSNVIGDKEKVDNGDTWNEAKQKCEVSYYVTYNEKVARFIEALNYPLKYSIRYLNNASGEYNYIDTSYLIHKRSGKLFPFSSRKYCVDPKKCFNGEFINPSVLVNDDNVDNYPINSLIEFTSFESVWCGCWWDSNLQQIVFDVPKYKAYLSNGYYIDENSYISNHFHNGFYMYTPQNDRTSLDEIWNYSAHSENATLHTIVYNEEQGALEITNMKVKKDNCGWDEEGDNVIGVNGILVDKFGNFICEYKGHSMFYNIYSKTFGRTNSKMSIFNADSWSGISSNYDHWTQQYYYRDTAEGTSVDGWTGQIDYAIFLNENMEEDYRIDWEFLWLERHIEGFSFPFGNVLENQREFLERSIVINKNQRLVIGERGVAKIGLDENGRYSKNMIIKSIFNSPVNFFYAGLDACYYMDGLNIHIVSFSNNYDSCEDTILASLDEYPFVERTWYAGNGVVGFDGMDNQLNTFTGYIYPDGTISSEFEEFATDSQTSTLSPIN